MHQVSNEHPDDLIQKLKANDGQALHSLYRANFPKIEKYVLDNNGSADDARDIYQDAFIALWRNIQLDRIDFTGLDKLQGYLFRIAQYKWLDHLRSQKRYKIESIGDTDIAEQATILLSSTEEEYLEKVKANYSKMESPCKEVLHRFYFLKETMLDIANAFSWTEATAKNNKYRCLQRLRNMFVLKKDNA